MGVESPFGAVIEKLIHVYFIYIMVHLSISVFAHMRLVQPIPYEMIIKKLYTTLIS